MSGVKSEVLFATLPEWLLYSEVSSQALRLYCVLNRYANEKQKAWPSRKKLAEKAHCSRATVDRAIRELEKVGAVRIKHRTGPEGDPTSNEYLLIVGPPSRVDEETPSRVDEETGSRASDDLTRVTKNESQIEPEKGVEPHAQKRKHQMPAGWQPSGDLVEWAEKKHPTIPWAEETLQFIDYHLARGTTFLSWDRAWQTWIRNAQKFAAGRNGSGRNGHTPFKDFAPEEYEDTRI